MEATNRKDVQEFANRNGLAYLVRVTDKYCGIKGHCEEECLTTVKAEADQWAKQWRKEYDKDCGFKVSRATIKAQPAPVEPAPAADCDEVAHFARLDREAVVEQQCTTALFLWQGFGAHARPMDDAEAAHYEGFIGLARTIAGWARVLDCILPVVNARGLDYPGVFEYDVTEPVGAYLRTTGAIVDTYALDHVAAMAANFFYPETSPEYEDLRKAFRDVMRW